MRVENRTGARLNGKLGTLYDVDVFCDTNLERGLCVIGVDNSFVMIKFSKVDWLLSSLIIFFFCWLMTFQPFISIRICTRF